MLPSPPSSSSASSSETSYLLSTSQCSHNHHYRIKNDKDSSTGRIALTTTGSTFHRTTGVALFLSVLLLTTGAAWKRSRQQTGNLQEYRNSYATQQQQLPPHQQQYYMNRLWLDESIVQLWQVWSTQFRQKYNNTATKIKQYASTGWNESGYWMHQAENDATKAENVTVSALNTSLVAVEESEWWNLTAQWYRFAWNASAQEAHQFYINMQQESKIAEKVWWNRTVQSERDWYNQSLLQLHKFGRRLKSFWNTTENKGTAYGHALDSSFRDWWHKANDKERQWWNDTVYAYRQFEHSADEKSRLWWNITENTAIHDWNTSVYKEHEWWNASQIWFHEHTMNAYELGESVLYLNNTQAYSILMNGYGWFDYSNHFFMLTGGLDAQINQAYCAIATSMAVLNSLRAWVELPVDPMYSPYHFATQHSLLDNECSNKNVIRYNSTFDGVFHAPGGVTLRQTKALLQCFLPGWSVELYTADPALRSIDDVRKDLNLALRDPQARVLINYDRSVLGQEGHGHFSPLGSYSPSQDAFLIMDVAKYKYPPVWAPAARLYAAMSTIDTCGDWNFPEGQDTLPDDLLRPDSSDSYHVALKALECKSSYRGYIIVQPR